MNEFTPYRTLFVDSEALPIPFRTLRDFLDIPQVRKHSDSPGFKNFHLRGATVIAIYADKAQIIGYVGTEFQLT